MQRTYNLYVKPRRFFEQCLHLCAVLSHYAYIIAPCLAGPFFVRVQRSEFSEAVGGKQYLIKAVISYHNFGPMHHRRGHEMESVFSKGKGVTFRYYHVPALKIGAEKLLHHSESLGAGNYNRVLIVIHKACDICRVVRLHMLYYKIVGLAAA